MVYRQYKNRHTTDSINEKLYNILRRKIASKVIGAKLIQGYCLRETPCTKCSMPLMEKPDASELECVVCPVLVMKVQKKVTDRKVAEQKKKWEEHAQQLKLKMKQNTERTLKEELQRQLEEEQGFLREVQATRKTATDFDEEEQRIMEQRIMDEIEKAREFRINVKHETRQLRVDDDDRYRVIEDLRSASKVERSIDMKNQTEDWAPAEEKSSDDKILKFIHEEELKQLIEDLRVAREQNDMEAKDRTEEAKEAAEMQRQFERLLALKEKEHADTVADFKKAQALMMEDAERREKELRNAEVRAKEAEGQLAKWRESTENLRRKKCTRENVNTRAVCCMPWLS